MFSRRSKVRTAAAGVLATTLALSACSADSSDEASGGDDLTDVTVVLGWFPSPESGGYYTAQQLGYYEDAGLNVTIELGGPQVSGTQLVASGRADFGITGAGANEIIQARDEGIPLKAVNAVIQESMTGMMVHADTGIESLEDTDGMTWVNSPGVLGVEWVKHEYGIDFPQMQFSGSIANFLQDDTLVQQEIAPNGPYVANQEGVEVTFLPFADTGFSPYNSVTFVTDDYLEENRDIVEAFVDASNQGWRDYMGDVEIAGEINNYLIEEAGSDYSLDHTWFWWEAQRDYILTGEGTETIGAMTPERWTDLIDQMQSLGVLSGEVALDDVADFTVTPDIAPLDALPEAPEGSY